MADFNKPATTDTYANVLAYINAKFSDLALGLDPANTTPTNVPTNAIRWNSANNRFEKWSGTAWGLWSSSFALQDITASGTVTLSGGTANGVPYLNASKQLVSGSALTFDGTTFLTSGNLQLGYASGYDGLVFSKQTAGGGTIVTSQNYAANAYVPFITNASYIAWQPNGSEGMRLTSTGLGIGTSSPGAKLHVQTSAGYNAYFQTSGSTLRVNYLNDAASANVSASFRATDFSWQKGDGSEVLKLDASGNLGLGVTPSAWAAGYNALQFGSGSSRASGLFTNGVDDTWLVSNSYFNGTNWVKYANGTAGAYEMAGGAHKWYSNATTGTGTFSFTQAMTLDASGNLLVGATSAASKFMVSNGGAAGLEFNPVSGYLGGAYIQGYNRNTGAFIPVEIIAQQIGFVTSATERARFDSAGNFLLGNTSTLVSAGSTYREAVVNGSTGSILSFGYGGTLGGYLLQNSSAFSLQSYQSIPLTFGTANTERARIHASGGVSIGNTTDPGATNLSVTGTIADGTGTMRPSVLSTTQSTSSGTMRDFASIPSWVKKITVMFSGVSTNGSSVIILQLGTSTGIETSGYSSTGWDGTNVSVTTGIALSGTVAAGNVRSGVFTLAHMGSNVWVGGGVIIRTESATGNFSAGTKTLGGTLEKIRITTVNGTDAFDAGSVNIMYE